MWGGRAEGVRRSPTLTNPKMLCCGMPVLRIRWARQGGKLRLGTEPFCSLEPSIAKAVAAHTGLHVG